MSRLRIIVLGYVVRGPIGGMAWHHLHYVLGLSRLGHDVLFVEDSDDYPSCYNPETHSVGTDPSYGLRFIEQAFNRLELDNCWAYYDAHRQLWHGPAAGRTAGSCQEADMLIDVSGVNPLRSWLEQIPVRVLIDTDPAFTQARHLNNSTARARALQHNAFFSFGELIQLGESAVPNDGIRWQATRQPLVLDTWPVVKGPRRRAYTTVMQWDSYPAVEIEGRLLGMKSDSFELVRDLPQRVAVPLEIALGGAAAPRRELCDLGWTLVDPLAVTRDLFTYQEYLQKSRGELSVAKHGYVVSRSGWFSERTACYLACGRPAVVQDTGFSAHIPCGEGLFAFCDAPSAEKALDEIESSYSQHCDAARDLAATYFHSSKVLTSLLERAFSTQPSGA